MASKIVETKRILKGSVKAKAWVDGSHRVVYLQGLDLTKEVPAFYFRERNHKIRGVVKTDAELKLYFVENPKLSRPSQEWLTKAADAEDAFSPHFAIGPFNHE